ncbi:MAG: hypothetical protein IID44_24475 [Planctomycetes bacterium]|nr:hypothetical protein [Planctomycetota bacterium]
MKYAITMLLVGCTLAAMFISCGSARAGPYELEIIVRAGDVIDGQTILTPFSSNPNNISINNDGEVVFLPRVVGPFGTGWGVMTQHRFIAGAGKLVDGLFAGFDNQDHSPKINNLGQVTYTAFLPGGDRGVFVDETLIARRGDVIDGQTLFSPSVATAINDDGTVVFVVRRADEVGERGPPGVYTQDRMVVESGQVIDGFTIGQPFGVEISNPGEIFSFTFLQDFGDGPSAAIVTPERIVLKPGDVIGGQRVDQIRRFAVSGNGDIVTEFYRFSDIDPDDRSLRGIFLATETEILVSRGDVVDGLTIHNPSHPRLNSAGQLAFFDFVQDEPNDDGYRALFADDQLIAAEGRLLDGKVIKQLSQFDINDRGDLAFHVEFEDSSRVIVRANHVQIPEPDALMLAAWGALFLLAKRGIHDSRRECPTRNEEVMR